MMIIYTVQNGDTLYRIAREFGVTVADLQRFNGLENSELLMPGQDVLVPVAGGIHTVASGESLYSIASHYNISLNSLINANPRIRPPYLIYPGDTVRIPQSTAPKKTIAVNGYTYPNIDRNVLRQALPYLTYLSIFSYSVSADGSLDSIDDRELIQTAKQAQVAPIMVITNTKPGEGFKSEITESVLNSRQTRQTLIDNVISTALSKGYLGVDVDFEYIYPKDKDAYNNFLAEIGTRLQQNSLTLSTAIAPKISAAQQGTLYEAHDYAFHGSVVDRVILMTYEWGYLYGPPMAVAPYNEVKRVLSYAVTEIPSEKILMGMPNYGYDWTLPYENGRPAKILSIEGALDLAKQYGVDIQFSQSAKAPFFEYTLDGKKHIVWFENARSTAARLQLINDFSLGGASYWTINQFYLQNWRVLEDMFNIEKLPGL